MPLTPGKSDTAFRKNVSEMIRAGHPQDQALAAAYREKRGYKKGGDVTIDISSLPDPSRFVRPTTTQVAPMMERFLPTGNPSSAYSAQIPPPISQGTSVPPQQAPRIYIPPHKPVSIPGDNTPLYGGYAAGGGITSAPWYARAESRNIAHPEGLIASHGAGRTDIHNIQVPSGSYIVPADVVSGVAEGNTLAGAGIMDRMMHSNPWGVAGGKGMHGGMKTKMPKFAKGGQASGEGHLVPIVVAGGEMLYHPHTIEKKFGNLKQGHKNLDAFVKKVRSKNVKTLSNLPGPKK